MLKTTLEQWQLLDMVVRKGSYLAAANECNRSQSSVSYNLSLLQERTGVMLLQPEGRRSVLTPAGEVLLSHVRPLLRAFSELESKAAQLRGDVFPRLNFYVDNIFPRDVLFRVIKQFCNNYPSTQIKLTEITEDEEPGDDADICILARRELQGKRGEWLTDIEFMAVAHREHPLCHEENVKENSLAQYPQIRITGKKDGYLQGVSSEQFFFSTIDAAIEAVICQLGYGWLPTIRIREHLHTGELLPLKIRHGEKRVTPLHIVLRDGMLQTDEQIITLKKLLHEQLSQLS